MGTIKKLKSKLSAKGSVLVFTLIVLFIILAVAIGISSVSVLERKGARSTDVSVQSFQIANSGAEIILKKIDANKSGTFAAIGCTAANGGKISGDISSGKNYEITFYTSDGLPITNCATVVSDVDKIKSVGSYANTARAIEVAVAATGMRIVGGKTFGSGTSTNYDVSDANLVFLVLFGNSHAGVGNYWLEKKADGWYISGFAGGGKYDSYTKLGVSAGLFRLAWADSLYDMQMQIVDVNTFYFWTYAPKTSIVGVTKFATN